jgi:hypothetical protein
LRQLRFAPERPDNITASAASARDEIGHAFAARIRETQTAREMEKIAGDVLPAILIRAARANSRLNVFVSLANSGG